ncbi:DHA2 family multidrug resistance protein-like MFS transporter [Actinoplanes octamycinicus]|uniref:DHA2 family multidrug resistance protein-like MFS transporter n=1 Tax=Actinoplanes octamycinicus TaxID=135948 RepID=A0A7W7H8D8_9ACTN|nr:MFS transporter [Actinoplanes octamycinicus]MBB4745784.1 DHA2 family multidrug resistance protein-like MFS transporter [Actinoplanes octamycinicus]GIE63751.1 MFS transporter [Actinoplanes octamycinicus]
MTETEALQAKAGRKEWFALGVLLLPVLLVSMDLTVLYYALPAMSAELGPTGAQQLWMVDIYAFVLAGLLLTMGTLGDKIGRRRLLLAGALAFGVGSLVAAYATSAGEFIAARAAMGVAGATLMPSTLALIRNLFHDQTQRRTAVAAWSGGMAAGAALGPIISGLLLDNFWWGSVFIINVPVMVLLVVLGPVLLPEFKVPGAPRFDLISAALSLGAVLPVIYGLKRIAIYGFGAVPVAAAACGLLLAALFVRRQQVIANPMIDLKLFRQRAYGASIAINLVALFGMVGFSLFSTQYLQTVLGLSPFRAALWTIPGTLAVGVAVPIATAVVRLVRPAYVVAGGFVLAAAGFFTVTFTPVEDGIPVLLPGLIALSAGLAVVMTMITEMVVATAPPEKAGAASAVLQTGQEFGGAIGVAVLGSIGGAIYSSQMEGVVPESARETLGGAMAAAAKLPAEAAAELTAKAHLAFVQEMHVAALFATLLMVLGAVLAVVALRHVKDAPKPPAEPEAETAEPVPGKEDYAIAGN